MTTQTGSNKKRTKGGQMTAFPLTAAQRDTVDQFLKLGQQLDKDAETVLQEAEKVKKIFASKPRGKTIDSCRTFDEFIDKNFPVSSSTVRRLLRKEGKTDKRFANKTKSKPSDEDLPEIPMAQEADDPLAVVPEKNAKEVLTSMSAYRDRLSTTEWYETLGLILSALQEEYRRLGPRKIGDGGRKAA